jgi:hypothetical protein
MSEGILETAIDEFRGIKKAAERAIAQVPDEHLHSAIDAESNSVAVIMRHMAGNMRSRWTDFLTSDGEKPDRMRDREFEDGAETREQLMADWEDGWQRVFRALMPLTDADLGRTVHIRTEPHTVYKAISRQVSHYAGHTYQIMMLARHFAGPAWKTLSIPRGQSEQFNQRMIERLRAKS